MSLILRRRLASHGFESNDDGWIENLDRDRLYAPQVKPLLEQVIGELDQLVGVEEIEVAAPAGASTRSGL